MMETSLDLLSRAATLVETDHASRESEATLKRGMDSQDPLTGELPSKLLKYQREKNNTQLTPMLTFEEQNKYNNKKCAGTQTPFSSFTEPSYAHNEDYNRERYILDLDKATTRSTNSPPPSNHPIATTNSSLSQSDAASSHGNHGNYTMHNFSHQHRHRDSSHSVPLNLTMTTSSSSPPSSSLSSGAPHQLRPSVITCAPPGGPTRELGIGQPQQTYGDPSGALRREVTSAMGGACDPIEEHFRRSLGKNYPECLSSPSRSATVSPSTSPGPATPPAGPPLAAPAPAPAPTTAPAAHAPAADSPTAVSITGTVDDHFAKSLGGSTWSEIKAKREPAPQMDLLAGSVDDHFSKALGDTWRKIKAEQQVKNGSRSSSPQSSPSSSSSRSSSPRERHQSMIIS